MHACGVMYSQKIVKCMINGCKRCTYNECACICSNEVGEILVLKCLHPEAGVGDNNW